MAANCFSSIAFCVSLLFVVYAQQLHHAAEHTSQLLFLKKTWNGETLAGDSAVIPVVFSTRPAADSKNIIVSFNSTSITLPEDKFLTPDVFGVLFKGEGDAIVQIEVVKSGNSKVLLFDGFNKLVEPKLQMKVDFNEDQKQVLNTWNGTITIPVEYLPRGTNEMAVYANYTQGTDNTIRVLTLKSSINETTHETRPNLLKQEFFTDYKPKVDVSKWSAVWQEVGKTSGDVIANQTESKPDAIKQDQKNEGSLIEQGIVTWILISAIFCGMLHVFVLAL